MKRLLLAWSFLALASLAFAQSSSHTLESTETPQFPEFAKHALIATYISNGYLGTIANPGVSPIDAVHTISCPGTTGNCLLQVDSWVQIGWGSYGQVGICIYVDGSQVGSCYYGADVPQDGAWLNVPTSLNVPGLSVGNHKVQTYISNTNASLTVGYYNINYQVFKP